MGVDSLPLRWPAAWKDSRMLDLLQATPIRYLIVDSAPKGLADQAKRAGFTIVDPQSPPQDVTMVRGPWPGIRVSHAGGDRATAGPTGEPWVDSNGWRIRVAQAMRPGVRVWVDARPQASRTSPQDSVLAFADSAAHGARWVVTL